MTVDHVPQAIVLGLTQGLTEFLPISSSAHLRLVPEALGWNDPGPSFTAIVQLGTVAAVVIAFWKDLGSLVHAGAKRVRGRPGYDGNDRLLLAVLLGTVPIAVLGILLADAIDGPLRSFEVIGAALLVGTAWLGWATLRARGRREITQVTLRDAGLVGAAQAAALVPGVSRSGATIGAGLLLGLDAPAAARFSFLLSVPAVVLAGLFGLRDVGSDVEVLPTLVATAIAFATGYLSIRWLLRLVSEGRLRGLLLYRLGLAIFAFTVAFR